MNKKILSLLLGVTLALSLCACGGGKTQDQNTDSTQAAVEADAAGAEKDAAAAEGRTESYPEIGLKLNYPAEFVNTKGYFGTESNGEVAKGINLMAFYYVAMPEEEYDELFQTE